MKRFLIVSVMVFICLGVNTQNNYKRGYIITNDNDSIAGWIDFRTDRMNQKQCKFKSSELSKETIYLPGEIAGYRFTDEGNYYVSRDIEINGKLQKVFLEYMVQGMMNLYSYYDGQQYFFFEDAAGKMTMITKEPDKIKNSMYVEDKKYKGVLLYMFKDYALVGDVVKKADFNQKSMIDIAKKYHDVCETGEECIIFENKKPDNIGVKVKFSVYTGLQLSTYIFSEQQGASYTSKNVAPVIGGQMNIFNPRWSKSFSAQIDFSFSVFKKKTDEISNQNGNNASWTYKVYDYKGYSFSGKMGIRYIYPKYRCRPVIEAGFSSLFFIDLSCEKYVTWVYTASENTTSEAVDYKMKSNYYGYYVGLGMDYCIRNEQAVFFRVQFENYVKHDKTQENYNDNVRVPQIKIGYTF